MLSNVCIDKYKIFITGQGYIKKKSVICVLKPSNNNKTWSSLLNKLQHLSKEKS